jgi:hypothetical protein
MHQRIYISGKVTGLDYDQVVDKFAIAQAKAMQQYPKAIIENPILITAQIDPTETWETFMRACLIELAKCTHIIMLPCWKQSPGAKVELKMAIDLGMEITFIN